MPACKTILFEVDGAVATLTLNRRACGNALNVEMAHDIQQALQAIEQDGNIRALIVTGAGEEFCSGQDSPDGDVAADPQSCSLALASLRASRVPIVMAINGIAASEGCSLALSGDVLLAARSANFLQLSTSTDNGPISAEQALQQGVINECLPDDELLSRAKELATKLAKGPTRALVLTRQLVDEGADNSFETQYRRELEVNQELRDSVDGREGVQAFLDKREAQFRGE